MILLREIRDAILQGPPHLAEPMHGCTCSGHAVSCAAGLRMREMLQQEDLIAGAGLLALPFEDAMHQLATLPGCSVFAINAWLAASSWR